LHKEAIVATNRAAYSRCEGHAVRQAYESGSRQDKLIESFAGTHDLIGGGKLSGLYDDQGNAARGRTDAEKMFHETWTMVAIPISAPFAMSEQLPSPVWDAISILLKPAR